jgi:hypothetical protein
MKKYLLLGSILAVTACSSDPQATSGTTGAGAGSSSTGSTTSSTGSTTTSTSSSGTGGSLPGYSVTFGPVTAVQPGEEHTQCVVKRLDNPTSMHVGQIHNELHDGSHHLIVYKTADTVEQTTPFDCQPFTDLLHPEKGVALMISQKKDDTLDLPAGVGITFDAGQMVRLEMHFINVTPNPLDVSATATFTPIPDAEFKDEAGFLFVGNPDISIPPHGKATVGPTYLPEPSQLKGVKYFGMTGHEHQFGTGVKVATSTAKMGTDTSIYDPPGWTWSEPQTVYYDPAVQIPSGGGFRFTCTYDNTSANQVGFGESAKDEMCFFWTYYYPSQGALVCAHSDKIPGGIDLCCPGSPLCSQIFK